MENALTTYSFWQLLRERTIAIPLLQRDYAQGRTDAKSKEIRDLFGKALRGAFADTGQAGKALGLDFVYGTNDERSLTPLDGQQRLTTLWLLHWHLAAAAGVDASADFRRFTYEGRAAARDFCAALAAALARGIALPTRPDTWNTALPDQPWFVPAWLRDPTVRGMLVMLDALTERFADLPPAAAWQALTAPDTQAPITFQFLDLGAYHLTDDLYTRMNARGKPLTEFENWKARFDEFLVENHPTEAAGFIGKLEGDWTDFFWRNRTTTNAKTEANDPAALVDAPFKALLDFITEMRWQQQRDPTAKEKPAQPLDRYEDVYAASETGVANLHFLMAALDALATVPLMSAFFGELLTVAEGDDERVRLFGNWDDAVPGSVNLFETCCQTAKASRIEQMLLFTLLTYAVGHGASGDPLTATPGLRDLLRVVRNRLLSVRTFGYFNLNLDTSELEKQRPKLLNEISELTHLTLQHGGAYAALAAWPTMANGWQSEQQKAPWLQPGGYWRVRLLRVEDSRHFRGALHLLLNGVEWPGDKSLENTLQAVERLWLAPDAFADPNFTSLVVRALAATPGDDFCEATTTYRFWGGGSNGWNIILAADAPRRSQAFRAFANLFEQGSGDWKLRLEHVINQQIAARKGEALNSKNGWYTTDWQKQWPYYLAKYPGMTQEKPNESMVCYYKWWNEQYGNRQYQSCAVLPWRTTMASHNFHPFAWAAVREWNERIAAGQLEPGLVTLESFAGNRGDEHPLHLKLASLTEPQPEAIRLYYGHIDPCGWRLVLPQNRSLASEIQEQFTWRSRTPPGQQNEQIWLTGTIGQEFDDIETVLEFARLLGQSGGLVAAPMEVG